MRPNVAAGTLIVWACFLALYPAGAVLFDWLTHGWSNLGWQLGSFAVLLVISLVWSWRRAA